MPEYSVTLQSRYINAAGWLLLVALIGIGVVWAWRCLRTPDRRHESIQGFFLVIASSWILLNLATSTSFQSMKFNETTLRLEPQGWRSSIVCAIGDVSDVSVKSFTHRLRKSYYLRIRLRDGVHYDSIPFAHPTVRKSMDVAIEALRKAVSKRHGTDKAEVAE